MKFFKLFSRKPKKATQETPTIPSLKSEELWQFIQKPSGTENDETRASDLVDLWANAKASAESATHSTDQGDKDWALTAA